MKHVPLAYYYALEHSVRSGYITAEQAVAELRNAEVDPAPWSGRLRQAEEEARCRAAKPS